MILKVFGLLDLYSALVMILVQQGLVSWKIVLTASAWLVIKGLLFRGEPASMIDLGIGAYLLIMFFLPIGLVTYVLAAYLVVKGVQSLA